MTGTRTESRSLLGTSSPSHRDRPLGERGDDDLVDLATAERVSDGHHGVAVADLAVRLGAHLAELPEHVVQAPLGELAGCLLIPGEASADGAEWHDDMGPHRSLGEPCGDRVGQRPARQRLVGDDQVGAHDRILHASRHDATGPIDAPPRVPDELGHSARPGHA